MAATEATIKTPTLSLVLAGGVVVAASYLVPSVPVWLAAFPLLVVVLEGVAMLLYGIRVARTAARAVEEQSQRLARDDDVRRAPAQAAPKGDRQ